MPNLCEKMFSHYQVPKIAHALYSAGVSLLAAIPRVAIGREKQLLVQIQVVAPMHSSKSPEYYLHHNHGLCPLNRKPPRSNDECQPGHINGDFPAVVSGESRLPLQPGHQEAGAHTRRQRTSGVDGVRRERHSRRPKPQHHLLPDGVGPKLSRPRTRITSSVRPDWPGGEKLLKGPHTSSDPHVWSRY